MSEPTQDELDEAAREAGELNDDDGGVPASQRALADATPQADVRADRDQLRNMTDAIVADVRRLAAKTGKQLKGGDIATIEKVAALAIKLAIDTRTTPETDTTAVASLARRKKAVDASLANVKAFATAAMATKFWAIVNGVLTRFFFALIRPL